MPFEAKPATENGRPKPNARTRKPKSQPRTWTEDLETDEEPLDVVLSTAVDDTTVFTEDAVDEDDSILIAAGSSVVRAFAHGAIGRRIDPSWSGPIELYLVPASAPRLV